MFVQILEGFIVNDFVVVCLFVGWNCMCFGVLYGFLVGEECFDCVGEYGGFLVVGFFCEVGLQQYFYFVVDEFYVIFGDEVEGCFEYIGEGLGC